MPVQEKACCKALQQLMQGSWLNSVIEVIEPSPVNMVAEVAYVNM